MVDGEHQETDNESEESPNRSRIIASAVVLGLVVIAAIVIVVATRSDDDASAANGARTTSASDSSEGRDSTSSVVDESPDPESSADPESSVGDDTAPNDGDAGGTSAVGDPLDPKLAVFVAPFPAGSEIEVCNAVVARMLQFRAVAGEQTLPDPVVLEAMSELEASIMTLADNQDWGDRIAVELTGVVREWADVRAANASDDTESEVESSRNAIEFLDRAIRLSDCPTN